MAINPACTPGWVDEILDDNNVPTGEFVACCGCGWEEDGIYSVSAAKRAQKKHRFPPQHAHEQEAATA